MRTSDAVVRLTPTERALLSFLLEHAGEAVSREALLTRFWGVPGQQDTRAVDAAVRRLRVKLGDGHGPPRWLTTVNGVGYRLEVDAEAAAKPATTPLPALHGRKAELAQAKDGDRAALSALRPTPVTAAHPSLGALYAGLAAFAAGERVSAPNTLDGLSLRVALTWVGDLPEVS